MAHIGKIKTNSAKNWIAQVRVQGFRGSKTFHTKQEAKEWAFEKERVAGKHGKIALSYTLEDAMNRYKEEVSPTRKGERWEKVRLIKLSKDPIATIQLSQLTTQDLQNWIDRQTLSPNSILRELTLIQSVLKRCRNPWRWMYEDVTKDLIKPKSPKHRTRRISIKEEKEIIEVLDYTEGRPVASHKQILAVGFLLALETGMRQGEIWSMEWDNVNLAKQFVLLPDTKNGSSREVPLSKRAITLLGKLGKQKGRVFKSNQASAGAQFRKAVKKCKIENLTFHDTRHEACTRLSEIYNVAQLAKVIGHQDLNSLQIYYNPTGAELAKLLN